jgi:hypothetical protein
MFISCEGTRRGMGIKMFWGSWVECYTSCEHRMYIDLMHVLC